MADKPLSNRGAGTNPPNRFEKLHLEADAEFDPEERSSSRTQFFQDRTSSIITYNDSPDVGFSASVNPYRGCEHGCVYCYARPFHEYLGFSSGLDFETKIMVKQDAAELLRKELASRRWQPQVIAMSGVTDCYQPAERQLKLTRGCLAVLAEFRNPVVIITKNHLVTRDLDLLSKLAAHQAATVYISLTTLDAELRRRMEPRTSTPAMRLAAVRALAQSGIPVGVLIAPLIPGLTDHEVPALLSAAAEAGAKFAGFVPLRLPHAVAALFEQWLQHNFPEKKEKVLNRIRSLRGGKLNDARFGYRMSGEGLFAEQMSQIFEVARRRAGLSSDGPDLSVAAFRSPINRQLVLELGQEF